MQARGEEIKKKKDNSITILMILTSGLGKGGPEGIEVRTGEDLKRGGEKRDFTQKFSPGVDVWKCASGSFTEDSIHRKKRQQSRPPRAKEGTGEVGEENCLAQSRKSKKCKKSGHTARTKKVTDRLAAWNPAI